MGEKIRWKDLPKDAKRDWYIIGALGFLALAMYAGVAFVIVHFVIKFW